MDNDVFDGMAIKDLLYQSNNEKTIFEKWYTRKAIIKHYKHRKIQEKNQKLN